MKLTALSDRQRYMALMSDVELGDRTSPQLLRHLEKLIGNSRFDDGFLRQALLGKLPKLVQTVIAAVPVSATVSESHAPPLSVTSVINSHQLLNHTMTTSAYIFVKFVPYLRS